MNNAKFLIIGIITFLIGGAIGYALGVRQNKTTENVSVSGLLVRGDTLSSNVTYESNNYLFSLTLPNSVAYAGVAAAKGTVFGARFFSSNADTSEQRNRNTPNGFNTSAYNIFGLLVYKNANVLRAENMSGVREWLSELGKNDVVKFEQSVISGNKIIRTEEADGSGSVGVYYYFFGPEFIYMFGTDDFPEEAMQLYLTGFKMLGRL